MASALELGWPSKDLLYKRRQYECYNLRKPTNDF